MGKYKVVIIYHRNLFEKIFNSSGLDKFSCLLKPFTFDNSKHRKQGRFNGSAMYWVTQRQQLFFLFRFKTKWWGKQIDTALFF